MTPPERRDFADRALWVLLPLGLLVVLLTVLLHAVNAPTWFWNGARLAPTIALAQGHELYQPADHGPILDTIYGPVTALVYLPAAIATSPTGAIFVAALIVGLFSTLPMLALALRQAGGDPTLRAWGLFGFVLYYCALFVHPDCTVYSTSLIHADAPSLGLGLLACLPLYRVNAPEAPGWRALSVSALLASLSVWSKQTSVFVPVALAAHLGLAWGVPCLRKYLLCLLVAGGGLSLLLVTCFGPGPLFFNLFTVPAAQAWNTPLLDAALELGGLLLAFAPVLLLALYFTQRAPGGTAPSRGAWWRANPWGMLLLLAVFAVPTSLLGRMKVGGNLNNHHPLFFLIGAIALALPAALAAGGDPWLRIVCKRLQLVLGAVLMLLPLDYLATWDGRLRLDNQHQQAYDFARRHPGKAWFPSHPLSTLLAERKLYHFEYGVLERSLAGRAPTPAHIRAHLPPRLRYVIFHRDRPAEILLGYLPAFGRRVPLRELPDWAVYARRRP
jgi:hypothetical protein